MRFIYSTLIVTVLAVSAFFLLNNVTNKSETAGAEEEVRKTPESDTLIPVLMYHHFVEAGEETSHTTITVESFEEQMKYLKSKGYIDDGYLSNYELAYPVLKENGMKATIYVIVSRMDGEYSLPRLTWEQAKEMSDSGVISIQSHTYDLHHKENVDAVEVSAMIAYDTEEHYRKIVDDLTLSKQLIEYKLGKEVVSLAYPYGHYDETTLSAVEEAGYKIAYTVKHGLNKADTNPFELHRINVTPDFTGERIEQEIIKQRELLSSEDGN